MNDFFDELETREPQVREAQQFEQLREQLRYAKANIPAYADLLHAVDPEEIKDRSLLARLPVTRKSEMGKAQAKAPPLFLSHRQIQRIFGVWRARCTQRVVVKGILSTTRFHITSRQRVLCWKVVRMPWVVRSFRQGLGRQNFRCRPWRIFGRTFMWGPRLS